MDMIHNAVKMCHYRLAAERDRRNIMKKKVLGNICFILAALLLCGCGHEELNREESGAGSIISKNIAVSGISENTVIADVNEDIAELLESKEGPYIEEVYNTFDWESIEEDLGYAPPIDTEIIDLNRNVNTESPNIEYEGSFPKGLVESIAKLMYQNNLTGERMSEKNDYFDFLARYGGGNNQLTLEELEELFPEVKEHRSEIETIEDAYQFCDAPEWRWCYQMFHFFSKENTEYYLYVCPRPGTGGYCDAFLRKRKNDEMEWTEDHIMMQAQGFAELICYEGEYYFVFIQSNKRIKYQDGIRIYRLESDDIKLDNVLIRCIPEGFEWREDYVSSESPGEELSLYIEEIKDDVTDSNYIERGDTHGAHDNMESDGEAAPEIPLVAEKGLEESLYQNILKLDFANMGVPIYYWTHMYQAESRSAHVQAGFYMYDKSRNKIFELERWSADTDAMQLWFHEIDGKVYTFLVYRLVGYNYMLTVKLIEGNEVTSIAQYHIIPRFSYEITEGKMYGY